MKKVKFRGENLNVVFGKYPNGRTAIRLMDEFGCPYATATVNLPDDELGEGEVFIKDYSENTGVLSALVDAGIISESKEKASSGFVEVDRCELLVDPR